MAFNVYIPCGFRSLCTRVSLPSRPGWWRQASAADIRLPAAEAGSASCSPVGQHSSPKQPRIMILEEKMVTEEENPDMETAHPTKHFRKLLYFCSKESDMFPHFIQSICMLWTVFSISIQQNWQVWTLVGNSFRYIENTIRREDSPHSTTTHAVILHN